MSGCSIYSTATTYGLKSMVNQEVYYRARYLDNCIPRPTIDPITCANWYSDQSKLDVAAKEAGDSLKIGGSRKLQMDRLHRTLAQVQKEYTQWAK
jgi:hypothetical protein